MRLSRKTATRSPRSSRARHSPPARPGACPELAVGACDLPIRECGRVAGRARAVSRRWCKLVLIRRSDSSSGSRPHQADARELAVEVVDLVGGQVGLRNILGLGERSMTAGAAASDSPAARQSERDPVAKKKVSVRRVVDRPRTDPGCHVDQRREQRKALPAVTPEDDVAGVSGTNEDEVVSGCCADVVFVERRSRPTSRSQHLVWIGDSPCLAAGTREEG